MTRKEEAVALIRKKLKNESFLTYKEIAELTSYHPKYILKLKREILAGTISLTHGNTSKIPVNKMSQKEKDYIISLYKRSTVSIKKFCTFYGRRSYSCIYNILKDAGLINKED